MAPTRGLSFVVGVPVIRDGEVRYVLSTGVDGAGLAGLLGRAPIGYGERIAKPAVG